MIEAKIKTVLERLDRLGSRVDSENTIDEQGSVRNANLLMSVTLASICLVLY